MAIQTSHSKTGFRGRHVKTRRPGNAIWNHRSYYLMLLPAFAAVLIFSYLPMYGIQIAFKDYKGSLGFAASKWVGLKYFKSFFTSYNCWALVRNTFALSIYSFLAGFPIPIIFALLLNEIRGRYKNVVQTVMYAPHFISLVVLAGMVIAMFSPSIGSVNTIIEMLGGEKVYFMGEPSAFRHIYVWSGIWQNVGWNSIIYIATLSSVDPTIHEAAVIDGASRLQRVWHISVKSIMPTMVILLILNTGSIMSVGFEKVFLMQNDLNSTTSDVISTYIYKRGLVNADYSFSSAVGLFNNVINFIILITVNGISRRLGETSLF